jgi:hypothetical protein
MATRKVKRYNGEDGSDVDMSEIRDEEGTLSKFRRNTETGETYDPEGSSVSKPVAASKPAASKPATSKPSVTRMSKEAGETARAKFRESSTPAPKKEMYRTLDGKMAEKAPKTDNFKGVRESIGSGLKSAGESVGSYLKSLGNREQKSGTYVKDGKVVRYASGGSASSRADGIATKGKTRGKMC